MSDRGNCPLCKQPKPDPFDHAALRRVYEDSYIHRCTACLQVWIDCDAQPLYPEGTTVEHGIVGSAPPPTGCNHPFAFAIEDKDGLRCGECGWRPSPPQRAEPTHDPKTVEAIAAFVASGPSPRYGLAVRIREKFLPKP